MTPRDILAPSQIEQLRAEGYVIVRQEDLNRIEVMAASLPDLVATAVIDALRRDRQEQAQRMVWPVGPMAPPQETPASNGG